MGNSLVIPDKGIIGFQAGQPSFRSLLAVASPLLRTMVMIGQGIRRTAQAGTLTLTEDLSG